MPPKLTYTQFKDLMRKHGEYASAMLIGLYTRYLEGDVAQCVADAMLPKVTKKPPVPTKPQPETKRQHKLSKEVLSARERKRKDLANTRKQEVLLLIDAHKKPMNVDEIGREMGLVPESMQVLLREMADENLIVVTKFHAGRRYKNLYSLPEKTGEGYEPLSA